MDPPKDKIQIGNRLFQKGMKCNLHFWHIINDPQIIVHRQDTMGYRHSSQTKEIIRMARFLYPNGQEIPHQLSTDAATKLTNEILINKNIIYNSCFTFSNFISRTDILIPNEDSSLDIVDISSNTNPKHENFIDLAFQKFVIESVGFKIKNITILYINSNISHTFPIQPDFFFKISNVTDKISYLEKEISEKSKYLISIANTKPQLNEKSCKSPKDCKISPNCWNVTEEMNIFTLRESNEISKRLFNNNIYYLRDIPDDTELNKVQKIQVECDRKGSIHIDTKEISDFLQKLKYPHYFLDFEAINPAIPLYSSTRAFQHIPFLYSLHIQNEDGNIENFHFIEEEGEDPRYGILKSLSSLINTKGSIICYNDTIEKKCIKESASIYPEFLHWWDDIKDNFIDLSLPFKNFSYYNPLQLGSTSLKSVITPLTGINYMNLNIHDGSIANREYLHLKLDQNISEEKRSTVKTDLIEYCRMDTYAMVEIIRKLKEL